MRAESDRKDKIEGKLEKLSDIVELRLLDRVDVLEKKYSNLWGRVEHLESLSLPDVKEPVPCDCEVCKAKRYYSNALNENTLILIEHAKCLKEG